MQPDNLDANDNQQQPRPDGRTYLNEPPSRDPQYRQQEATANIARSQIDSIFDTGSRPAAQIQASRPAARPVQAVPPPQAQNPQPSVQPQATAQPVRSQPSVQAADWKNYHSAWQNYYQRYYESYYTQQVTSAKQALNSAAKPAPQQQPTTPQQPTGSATVKDSQQANRNQAVDELRGKLLKKVESSAKQARKSRHFVPIAATVMVLVVFGFLQYNEILIANVKAYVTPGSIDPQNIIIEPESTTKVSPEPRLIIPKINVDSPVTYDISTDEASQNVAMQDGVAHFPVPGANSHPGEVGNTVLSGHSSNDVFAPGDYKYIFMQLDKLDVGDVIYANYKSTRYTYVVTETKEVGPANVKSLIYETDKPEMTLITCTPLGTALRRLLVTAEQVYPETSKPAPKQEDSEKDEPIIIPGEGESSILSRLFGA